MYSFRRLALLLAFGLPACLAVQAQSTSPDSSSSSNPPAQAQAAGPTTGQLSVQARIRARRAQRRAAAIHEVYDHRYDVNLGMGFLRFTPGPAVQRVMLYAWDTGITRYYNERLGVSVDGRGYYGTVFTGIGGVTDSGITKPAISQYTGLVGPTYRFYLQPKYAISGRVLGGFTTGNFSGDTNGYGGPALGLYKDSTAFAASASVIAEYNLSPNLSLRVAPEYFATTFGSTTQNSLGFTGGMVYRFGKQ